MIEENNGDSSETIVLDIGSCFAKSGWSGEEEPRFSYRSIVGYPKFKKVATHMVHMKECYVGAEAQEKRSMLNLSLIIVTKQTGIMWRCYYTIFSL
jgi:actin-related protein